MVTLRPLEVSLLFGVLTRISPAACSGVCFHDWSRVKPLKQGGEHVSYLEPRKGKTGVAVAPSVAILLKKQSWRAEYKVAAMKREKSRVMWLNQREGRTAWGTSWFWEGPGILSGRKAPRVSRPGPEGQEEVKVPKRPLLGRPLPSETRRGLIATKKFPSVQFHPVLCLCE